MRRFLVAFFVIVGLSANAQPDKWTQKKFFTVMSYNVENLFDTIKNAGKNDVEFTHILPSSLR